jgi:hypothetical protein
MKPLILNDGGESGATFQATRDEEYYMSLVTFEVKGKSQEQF